MAIPKFKKIKKLARKDNFTNGRFSRANLTIFAVIFAAIGGYLIYSSFAAGSCTTTISPGANIASTVSSSAAGSVVCLNDGSYGTVDFGGISKSSLVTVRAVNSKAASLTAHFFDSNNIGLESLTIGGGYILSCSTHIHITNSTFTSGMYVRNDSNGACSSTNDDIVFDGAIFDKVGQGTGEGRLTLAGVNGGVVKNSTFSGILGSSPADGIQVGNGKNLTIGPNNVFDGILESLCGAVHCDALQLVGGGPNVTITGNYFKNCDTFIMAPDGSNTVTVDNNVFDGSGSSYPDKIQFGSAASPIFKHNTVRDVRVSFDSKTGEAASTNAIAQNNVMVGTTAFKNSNGESSNFKTSNGNGCSGCTFSYNLFDDSGSSRGTNNIIGTPTFTGGTSPATYSGFALTSTSLGHLAGNDGKDMGIDVSTVSGCDTTLSSGGNLATALTNVAAGGKVCLNAGTYSYNASISKSAMTTVAAAAGVNKSQITFTSFQTNQSQNITFDNITISDDGSIGNNPSTTGSVHLHLTNSSVVKPGSLCIQQGNSNADVVIDGVDFGDTDQSPCGEGRLDVKSSCTNCGITIKNSTFGPNGAADGIQLHWGVDGVTVGPGNIFSGIVEEACGAVHCDSIQPYGASNITITGNYFYNDSTIIADFDCASGGGGGSPMFVTNNVVYQQPSSAAAAVSISGANGDTIIHNTFGPGTDVQIYGGNQGCSSTNATVKDNIMQGGFSSNATASNVDHNLLPSGCTGTGCLNGAPTYVGGTTPSTWAGFTLAAGSLGKNAASDGTDMGAQTFGSDSGTTSPPTVSLTANPTTINSGSSSILTWSSTNSNSCSATSPSGWTNSIATSGTKSVSPTVTTTYTISCTGDGGTNTANATVTVNLPVGCFQSSASWSNHSFTTQTSNFTFDFDATPSANNIDSITGLSNGPASDFTSLAAIVRFNDTGTIDARNGAIYTAVNTVPYTGGTSYHFKLTINVASHTYSVSVTPAGGSATAIATNYAFRAEQASVSSLNNWATNSVGGFHTVCSVTINASSSSKIGDINKDGNVDIFDLSILLSNYNTSTASCDLNTDSTVNIFDLSILLSNYGT